jgi:hypothetical protein
MLADIVRAGLATAKTKRMLAGGRAMAIARVRITAAGRPSAREKSAHTALATKGGRDGYFPNSCLG